jgi:hypothetical protein
LVYTPGSVGIRLLPFGEEDIAAAGYHGRLTCGQMTWV